ncbi:MAG: cation:proton antiporter [Ardenticatenaceae bacterium]|nr:cation:proton antiporter [Ardenticatenaceae bacterium]
MSREFLNFIFSLVVIIMAAKGTGYITARLGQPSVLGELLAGLILGPTILDVFHTWPSLGDDHMLLETIKMMAEMGVILLMFLAGLELEISELLSSGRVSALAGVLGVVVPFVLGIGTALLFGGALDQAIFVGLALSATSVSISAQTLIELNVLSSRVGLALLGAAVFDDILVILLLSVTSLLVGGTGGLLEILLTILRMIGFLVAGSAIGFYLLPRLVRWVNRLPISQGTVAFILCASLVFAWSAEVIGGVAAITGAFMVGLFLARLPFKDQIEHGFATMAYGLFVPIFFVNIGLEVNMRAITGSAWVYAIVLTLVAIGSKIIGSGIGAQLSGFSRLEALRLGIGMVSRGEVGLIVAAFALSQGLLSADTFSIVVFMVIVATLVTPPMLRLVYSPRFTPEAALQTEDPL